MVCFSGITSTSLSPLLLHSLYSNYENFWQKLEGCLRNMWAPSFCRDSSRAHIKPCGEYHLCVLVGHYALPGEMALNLRHGYSMFIFSCSLTALTSVHKFDAILIDKYSPGLSSPNFVLPPFPKKNRIDSNVLPATS